MSMILREAIENRNMSMRKKIAYFIAVYAFKMIIICIIIWLFLVIRNDFMEVYKNCEPFIIHAINMSNVTFENVTFNLTIIPGI